MSPPAAPTASRSDALRGVARRGLYVLALCLVIALALAADRPDRLPVSIVYSFAIGLLSYLAIDGGRLLVARWLLRRGGDEAALRGGWPGWPWMVAVILLGVPLAYALGMLIGDALTGARSVAHDEPAALRGYALLLAMSIAAAAVGTFFFYTRGRLESAQRIAAETELRLLQSQLEPHMLFNTLANLRVLIGLDPPRAQAMLDRLIAFLRATLAASRAERQSLAAEFERTADYLALIGIRMGDRLRVQLELPDALRTLAVPPLLLQPLVENAVKHGLEPKVEGGLIAVRASRDGDRLQLEVQDDGVGLGTMARGGFGTAQVRERLATLYGERARFELLDAGGGTLARIVLPAES